MKHLGPNISQEERDRLDDLGLVAVDMIEGDRGANHMAAVLLS